MPNRLTWLSSGSLRLVANQVALSIAFDDGKGGFARVDAVARRLLEQGLSMGNPGASALLGHAFENGCAVVDDADKAKSQY